FFQAADGIRDFHVTGVQTCALPISCRCPAWPSRSMWMTTERRLLLVEDDTAFARTLARSFERRGYTVRNVPGHDGLPELLERFRSEERRVGQECITPWAPSTESTDM